MRKLISLGMLALLISIFSSQVFASNAAACDEVKLTKGLHGLCVAWHNANEKNKEKFAAKYREKSGGEEVPGSEPEPDFYCPCYMDISFDNICSLGSPTFALIFPSFGVVEYQYPELGVDEFISAEVVRDNEGLIDGGGCIYDGQFSAPQVLGDLNADEAAYCLAEIAVISAMYNGGSCD